MTAQDNSPDFDMGLGPDTRFFSVSAPVRIGMSCATSKVSILAAAHNWMCRMVSAQSGSKNTPTQALPLAPEAPLVQGTTVFLLTLTLITESPVGKS